jgi:PQQ-like domain
MSPASLRSAWSAVSLDRRATRRDPGGACPWFRSLQLGRRAAAWLQGAPLWALATWCGLSVAADVLTGNYDPARTGATLSETRLDTKNVAPRTFGKVASFPVDGPVLAQPLVATDVAVGQGDRRDVLYVATGGNSVYAFDARSGAPDPLWRKVLDRLPGGAPGEPQGIVGTPVIDRSDRVLYVVAAMMDGDSGRFVLHALDLADGREKFGGPVAIAGAVQVDGTNVPFRPTRTRIAVQRAALALAQDKVIVAFGGDYFEGWVFAIDRRELGAVASAFCTTCASLAKSVSHVDYLDSACTFLGPGGGIWQSGRGPAVDERGMVYFFTGNKAHIIHKGCRVPPGTNACSACSDPAGCPCVGVGQPKVCRGPETCIANQSADRRLFDTNEALIRLDPGHGLALTGWWRPANWNIDGPDGLEKNDLDLGGSGPLLLPGRDRVIGGGKQGVLYLVDVAPGPAGCVASMASSCLGARGPNPLQSFAIAPPPPDPMSYYRHLLGGPVLWNRTTSAGGPRAYVWRENDVLRRYALDEGAFRDCHSSTPAPTATHDCASDAQGGEFIDHHPGGILALSARGDDPATAIVWAYTHLVGGGPGTLMAYRANPEAGSDGRLARLWDSDMCPGDRIDVGTEFAPPTVADGRVYMATGASRVDVFGLVPERDCTPPPAGGDGPGLLLQ